MSYQVLFMITNDLIKHNLSSSSTFEFWWRGQIIWTLTLCLIWWNYTIYDILCHYGNFLNGILIMNKWTYIDMGDGWVHPLAKTLPSLVNNFWWNIVMDETIFRILKFETNDIILTHSPLNTQDHCHLPNDNHIHGCSIWLLHIYIMINALIHKSAHSPSSTYIICIVIVGDNWREYHMTIGATYTISLEDRSN